MAETIVHFLENHHISPYLIIFLVSLMPILEIRGGLIAAAVLQVPLVPAFLVAAAANMIPIPFILLFIRQIFKWMKRIKWFQRLVEWCERKAEKHGEKMKKAEIWGLYVFVGIPLPGTGGWTGALVAAFLEMPLKKALPVIFAGVVTAGLIIAALAYGLPEIFGLLPQGDAMSSGSAEILCLTPCRIWSSV